MKKVVLGLSGGVDSAVAAALLRSQDYEVHGLFLDMGLGGEEGARTVAESLGIHFHVARRGDELNAFVCSYFAEEYQQARTPNPCIVCNPKVKFKALIDCANEMGIEQVATGHYARVGRDGEGRALLMRSPSVKDQSYMLYRLPREIVARCIFPLGEVRDKNEVRELARRFGIPVSEKKDSMDICFVPDGDHCSWLESRGVQMPAGNFVDAAGKILGRHYGIHRYTVGQRKGLGVAAEGRLFVHELRPATNEIVLSLTDIYRSEVTVKDTVYIAPEFVSNPFACEVCVRYSKKGEAAQVYPMESGARILFRKAVRAPAAGQSAVFYNGDIVIGGGFLE